ncbi:MAG: replication-associated recombination protein A [Brevinemataceae bacterium]
MPLFDNDSLYTKDQPLARRMSPKNIQEYQGQRHLLAKNMPIEAMIQSKTVQSMIFYGPPASGKTALSRIISDSIDARFVSVNALTLNSDDIRQIITEAARNRAGNQKTVLFVDEIHRLSKPKQDAFLDVLESGMIILLGATTENPYFVLQPAFRSRLLIFEFFSLTRDQLKQILMRALSEDIFLKTLNLTLSEEAEYFLLDHSSDPRNMLTILETTVLAKSLASSIISLEDLKKTIQKSDTVYDSKQAHYDIISAFIKSIRGSDPDAALYYLAVMIESGEDPAFIFRRLLILAVEDIGLAYPEAVSIVHACAESYQKIGMPEARYHLAHAVLLLAGLPKSNSALAIDDALQFVKQGNRIPIPDYLKDTHSFSKQHTYLYPHNYPNHFVDQKYMSNPVSFYHPQNLGFEKRIGENLSALWKNRKSYNILNSINDKNEISDN